jgi:predicted RND superfamily exporter protein
LTATEPRGRLPRALIGLGLARPRTVIAAWVLLALLASLGVARLQVETSTDSILDHSGPSWTFYQESQRRFGGDEILTVLIEAPRPFDPGTLAEVVRLTEVFEAVEGVWRVDSLATVPLIRSVPGGDVSLEAALAEGVPGSPAELSRLRRAVEHDRIAPETLVSADGRYFGVNLVLAQGAEAYYDGVLAKLKDELAGQRAWVSGVPIFRMAADGRTRSELLLFTPLTVGAIGALLFLLFGSAAAVAIPLVSSGLATWTVLGAMGAVGVPVTITTMVLPSILLALGCAYCMHLLTAFVGADAGADPRAALAPLGLPVALSGLTTAIGFLAVSFVRIDAIRDIGAFGALGVLLMAATALTLTPAALRLWPPPRRRIRFQTWLAEAGSRWIVAFVVRRRRAIALAWLAALGGVGIGVLRIAVETDVIVWFPRDDPIRVAYLKIREVLSGISPMNVVVEAEDGGSVESPEVIRAVDGLTAYLQSLDEVGRALSIADPLRMIHGAFTDDPRDPLPDDRGLIGQYLVILESKVYTHDLITADRSATNVLLRVDDNASASLLAVGRKARDWWEASGAPSARVRATGIMHEFAHAEDAIAYGQLRGLAFALSAIAVILLAIFRWPRLSLIALAPNAIPVAMAFGTMGLLRIPLDAGTVVLGNLALGIAVDDTIHLVAGFHRERESGAPTREALVEAFRGVLPAVVFTTLAVALGFLVLGVSNFTVTRHLGLLTAGIMVLCLLADLLLLPALLLGLERPPGPGAEARLKPRA